MDRASALFSSAVKSAKKKAEYAKKKGEEGVKAAKEAMGVQSKGKSSVPSSSSSKNHFDVLLERTAACSNLGLQMASDSHGLYVNYIGEAGLVSDWNVCHDEDTRIRPGDRLLAISSDMVPPMACDHGNINECLEVLKKASRLQLTLRRVPVATLASMASSTGTPAQPNRSGTRVPRQVVIDDRAISGLCALGFSAAAAKHALVRCGGNPNYAALWLEDAANADEIARAEMIADTEENEWMAAQVQQIAQSPAAFEAATDGALDDAPELRQELLEKLGVKPRQFSISVEKSEDNKLGLEMDSDTCEVLEVKDGLVAQWNSVNSAECQVQAGDVFVAIEGTDNSTAAMMTALMTESSLSITVQRLEDPYCLGSMSTEELHELLLNYNAQAAQELTKTGKAEVVDSACCAADPNSVETGMNQLTAEQRAAMRAAAEQRFAVGEKNRRTMEDWRREQRALEQNKEPGPNATSEPSKSSVQEETSLATSMEAGDKDTSAPPVEDACVNDKIEHSEVEPEEKTEVVLEKTPLLEDTSAPPVENACINDKIEHSEVEPEEKTEVVLEKTPLLEEAGNPVPSEDVTEPIVGEVVETKVVEEVATSEDTSAPPVVDACVNDKIEHSEVEPEGKTEVVLEKTPLIEDTSAPPMENACINEKIEHSEVEPEEKNKVVLEKTPLLEDPRQTEIGKESQSEQF